MRKLVLSIGISMTIFSFFNISCARPDGCPAKKIEVKSSSRTANLKRNVLLNTPFPEIKVRTLTKKEINLPKETLGKPTIICLAFDGAVQNLVDSWASPLLAKYTNQEINYYEVPLIKTGYKLFRGFIDGGMRSGVDKNLHNNVATYYGSLSSLKKNLLMDNKKTCYLFLLDNSGIIRYVSDESADEAKLLCLYNAIEEIKNPQTSKTVISKDTITYVFDPLCGFCYAFEPEIKKLEAKYKDKFVFEIISGGMILGTSEGPISKVAPHIAMGYKQLEKMSSCRFGDPFLKGIMKLGTYKMSSELPSIALEVFKSMKPSDAISFANDVQLMFYFDGKSLNDPENYKTLVETYGLSGSDFISKLALPEWKAKAYSQFSEAERMGVTSFPVLILKQKGKIQVINAGFETYQNLIKIYPFG
jgi:putative protein-disulfide isomerase